jgi:HK97 family phage portal protein
VILSNGQAVPLNIDTIADQTPMFADANYYPDSALSMLGTWAAYGALYKQQLWVGIVIRKLAMGAARMPFDVKRQGEGNNQQPELGPLADLLTRPNPRMSGFRLWQWTVATKKIYGEAFWVKLRDQNGRVRELHPMHPTNTIVRRKQDGDELEYIFSSGVRNVSLLPPIPEADVVPFLTYNPESPRRGISPLEGLRMTLLNEDASRRATSSFWANGARPGVILKHPTTLSNEAADRISKSFDSIHAGADRMGRTAVLDEGMDAVVMQLNAEEMQYIESRKLNREEVCAAYDVPPPVVHILDHATYSNITEQLRSMYRDTMAPEFVDLESVVNHHLVTDFYGSDSGVFTRFNMDEVLRGDFETRATAVGTLIEKGVLKPSEARPMFSLPDVGGNSDMLYGNAALVPLGSPAERVSITATAPETPAQAGEAASATAAADQAASASPTKAAYVPLIRSVRGEVGRTSLKDARDVLVKQHAKALSEFMDAQRAKVKGQLGLKAAGSVDLSSDNAPLADLLHALGIATASVVGPRVAKSIGGQFSTDALTAWLQKNAEASAEAINSSTEDQIDEALADPEADPADAVDQLYDGTVSARVAAMALTRVAVASGIATVSAGQQNGAGSKTWVTAGPNPRPSHAAMDGETVSLDDSFSNGMRWPGDPSGGADEVAGCTCSVAVTR